MRKDLRQGLSSLRSIHYRGALFLFLVLSVSGWGQQEASAPSIWQAAVDEFTQQVLSRAGSPTVISLNFTNLSTLSPGEQTAIRQATMADLRNAGVRLAKGDAVQPAIDITFSEDWQNYVWLAEIKQGQTTQMVISRVPRPQKPGAQRANLLTIRKNLIWQQDGAILDFYTDGQNLVVLEAEQVSLYASDAGTWRPKQVLAITHDRPWPRDLRGRLQVSGLQVTAFLPGTMCSGSLTPPVIQCHASDDPWMIDQASLAAFFSPARNFFTGVLAGHSAGESVAPFFSAVSIQIGGLREWAFAGTDGRSRVFLNDLSAAAIVVNDWGSSLASVQSNCGGGWQILATSPGDLNRPDSIQAFEIAGSSDEPVSSTLDLSGPVIAFWPGETPQNAHVVTESVATGKFEAWNLTEVCN